MIRINPKKWSTIKLLCTLVLMLGLSSSVENSSTSNRRMTLQPPLLQRGDKVAIVAPAFWLVGAKNIVREVTKMLQSWGLEVVLGQHIHARHYRFAGTDEQRAEDLQWALDDPAIRAVLALRGGYGTTPYCRSA